MRVRRIVTAMMAGCAAVVISAVPGLAAQMPPEPQRAATDTVKPPEGMAAKCQAMMAERDKMMPDMKAADQRLDDFVARTNTASGMEKMTAPATVVTEMVTQRRTMREGMMKMQQGMMGHMMIATLTAVAVTTSYFAQSAERTRERDEREPSDT